MIIYIQVFSLACTIIAYIVFLRVLFKNGQGHSLYLAIGTFCLLFCLTLIILWMGVYENWIIRIGGAFSLLVSFLIWTLPKLSPELSKLLHINNDVKGRTLTNKDADSQKKLFSSLCTFAYIVLGYWFVWLCFDPKKFISEFMHQLWIIPIAFLLSYVQYRNDKNL